MTEITIDTLNDLDPLNLTRDENEEYVRQLIAKHRKGRESGVRPKKDTGPKLDLVALGLLKAPAPITMKRRI